MITLGLGQQDWSLGYEASRVWGIHTLPFPLHILVFFIFQYGHLKVKELCFFTRKKTIGGTLIGPQIIGDHNLDMCTNPKP